MTQINKNPGIANVRVLPNRVSQPMTEVTCSMRIFQESIPNCPTHNQQALYIAILHCLYLISHAKRQVSTTGTFSVCLRLAAIIIIKKNWKEKRWWLLLMTLSHHNRSSVEAACQCFSVGPSQPLPSYSSSILCPVKKLELARNSAMNYTPLMPSSRPDATKPHVN